MRVENFLIDVQADQLSGTFQAVFADGLTVELDSNNYQDAVLEADLLQVE